MKRDDLEKLMVGVFSDLRPNSYVDIDTKIKEDLNLDSLELFSACIEIEERTKLEVCKYISNDIVTINDLLEEITHKKRSKYDIDYSKYPKKKDEKRLAKMLKFLDSVYDVRVSGIEYISDKKQLICPNHESNYDPFMVLLAFYKNKRNYIISVILLSISIIILIIGAIDCTNSFMAHYMTNKKTYFLNCISINFFVIILLTIALMFLRVMQIMDINIVKKNEEAINADEYVKTHENKISTDDENQNQLNKIQ
ncbi:MAG: hypothetical protein IK068_00470 [Lachnospiraceae bacterium]|nr:hypothetical protein [Lachnospiraceae bacterium]